MTSQRHHYDIPHTLVHKVGLNFTLDLACRDYPARGLKMEVW